MKIVHAVCTDALAGVERHVARLAAAQSDVGHVVVVAGGSEDMPHAINRSEVVHVAAPTVSAMSRFLTRQRDADIVNVHMTAAEIAMALAGSRGGPSVVATRHFAARRGRSSNLAALVGRWAARRVDVQIAVSHYVAEHVEPPSIVVLSGVPAAPDAAAPTSRERVVLVAQRLESEKRTEDAVQIFAASGLADQGWTLEIVGLGSERDRLERAAADAGLGDRVRFLGHRTDIDALMRRASVLLAPRTDEALGLTVLEAMSEGLPVVAAGAAGHLETIGAVAPELCYPVGDLSEATAILEAVALDPHRRAELATRLQAAQRRSFSIEAQQAATETVYRSVL